MSYISPRTYLGHVLEVADVVLLGAHDLLRDVRARLKIFVPAARVEGQYHRLRQQHCLAAVHEHLARARDDLTGVLKKYYCEIEFSNI